MSYIPKNAKKLLNNAKLMRQYALKPYGFTIPQNCNFPKSQPQYKFFQKKMVLHRPGPTQKIQANTLVFKVDEQMSKPQIKQYLEKLYGLKIQKVNTARFMGKVVRNHLRKPSLTKSFKKAFIIADHKVPEFINQAIL